MRTTDPPIDSYRLYQLNVDQQPTSYSNISCLEFFNRHLKHTLKQYTAFSFWNIILTCIGLSAPLSEDSPFLLQRFETLNIIINVSRPVNNVRVVAGLYQQSDLTFAQISAISSYVMVGLIVTIIVKLFATLKLSSRHLLFISSTLNHNPRNRCPLEPESSQHRHQKEDIHSFIYSFIHSFIHIHSFRLFL